MSVKRTSIDATPEFTESKLILVEGKDDQELLTGIIEFLELGGFQVHAMGGKPKWQAKTRAIVASHSFQDSVRALAMVRDCDDSPAGSWTSCRDAIERSGLEAPDEAYALSASNAKVQTAVALLPSSSDSGTLEDLVIPTLNSDRRECVGTYFSCLRSSGLSFSENSKATLQAYLAGLQEPARDLHIAISSGEVDFGHASYDVLRSFVSALGAV